VGDPVDAEGVGQRHATWLRKQPEQVGRRSSHFFFRYLHVRHPEVDLGKLRLGLCNASVNELVVGTALHVSI
jgi:hypothetical protein